jgi:hypothetical protein
MGAVRKNGVNFLEDRTVDINKIENQYGLLGQLGVFSETGVRTRTFQYDQIESGFSLPEDRPWGSRRDQFVDKNVVKTHSFAIPHFPFDGHIMPEDVQSQRAPGTDQEFSTFDQKVAEELVNINRSWAMVREWSRLQLLIYGTVYAPNSTVVTNYYTDLGYTQKDVDYDIDTGGTGVPQAKSEEVIAHIQDNIQDGSLVSEFISLDSPEFFSKLTTNTNVKEAYSQFAATNANGNFLRDRLPTMGRGHRTFIDQAGILHIEYRGSVKGTPLIPAGEARIFPLASGIFKTFYAPMSHNDYVNTVGVPMYAFVYENDRGQGYDIESESNFAHFMAKPQVVVKARIT